MDVTLLRHPLTPLLRLPNTSEYAAMFLPWSPYNRPPYDCALKLKAVHVVTPLRGQTLASLAFAKSSSPLESVGGFTKILALLIASCMRPVLHRRCVRNLQVIVCFNTCHVLMSPL